MVREPAARGIRCGRVKCGVPDIDKRDFAFSRLLARHDRTGHDDQGGSCE